MSAEAGPNAVRDAIAAVLHDGGPIQRMDSEHPGVDPWTPLIDRLVAAVEAVPVKVTIRDLSMADDENIVRIKNPTDLEYLTRHVRLAYDEGEPLCLTVDGGYLKFKVGDKDWGYSWSAPIHTEVYGS